MQKEKDCLTASRISTLQRCPRASFLRDELGLRKTERALALRLGSAWHKSMEARNLGKNYEQSLAAGIGNGVDVDEFQVAMLSGMLTGYWHLYGADQWITTPEIRFCYALRRGRGAMWAAGVIDGLRVKPNCVVIEYKTAGGDISQDSDYWLRLRGNFQVLQYVDGARVLGYDPYCIIYDVARKPGIRVKQNESIAEFAERLKADCIERPDFYFAQREIPILEDDLARFRAERNQLANEIQWRRRTCSWPRAVSERTCASCEFAGFCLQGTQPDAEHVPSGFTIGQKHEELVQTPEVETV
jgi:hypothetical protein